MIKEVAQPLQKLSHRVLNCGESPLYDYRQNCLYWVDSARSGIYCYDLGTAETRFEPTPADVTFVTLNQGGGLVLGSTQGIFIRSTSGKISPSTLENAALATHLNDAIADPEGRIFTGQEAYSDEEPNQTGYLFRLSPNGRVDIVEEGLSIANGMGFSPDMSTFYLVDTIRRELYAYRYWRESGEISDRRVLKKFTREEGLPDGMTVDEEGCLWIAMWFGQAIVRLDPEGNQVSRIKLPFAQPTSVGFGGKDFNRLYITSAAHFWKTPLAPKDHDYHQNRGGEVYWIELNIRGRPEYMARINT